MLWLLFNHEELCVCDIMEALGITQSKASRHLSTLRHAGLVTDRRTAYGPTNRYGRHRNKVASR
jgi:DNA-binding transcriptional ArsR family regulator